MVRQGPEALEDVVYRYPTAHAHFGEHQSIHHFAAAVSAPGWTTLEAENCWMFAQDIGNLSWEVHWFCPKGANLTAMRAMLRVLFEEKGAWKVQGTVPWGVTYEKEARLVNRALGAVKINRTYVLTRDRFMTYTASNSQRGD